MTRAQVLDHGYVEPIDTWGSDERIIEAARMSTAVGALVAERFPRTWALFDEGRPR